MKYPFEINAYSEVDTENIANLFAKEIVKGDVIVLNGNLGAGKTFFVKNTLKYFGISNVNSPTFAIVNEYFGKFKFYHFDFYRINNVAELYDIGFNDYLNDADSVTFIEWGNIYPEVLPYKRIEINIEMLENFRLFKFVKYE